MGRRNASRTKSRNYRRKMRAYNTRSRLFNGNVYYPGEFIAVWVILLAFIVGLWIMCMNTGLHKRDYVRTNLVYEGSYRKEDCIVLTLSGKEYKAWASLCDLEGINKLKEGESLSVITSKDELVCIRYDNKELLSQEDAESHDVEDKRQISIFFGILAAFWLIYVAASVYVMCNAERFPRLVKWFVKPSYLTRPPRK